MRDPIKKPPILSFLLLLGVVAWLYLTSFVPPNVPIYQGDSSPIFLHEAVRMLHGQTIYKEFFELMLPGTQFVFWGVFKLLGVRAWTVNVMFILLGTCLAWSGVMVARHVLEGKLVYLPSVLFLGFAYATERDPTHHWYSTLAVMAALVAVIPKRSMWRLAVAGALCGLATLFTQTRGPAAIMGMALFLLWERHQKKESWQHLMKTQASLWLPFLVTTLGAIAYLVVRAGFQQVFLCTVTFPFKYYRLWYWNTPQVYLSEVPALSWPLQPPAVGIWLSMHVLLPLVYLLFLARWWRIAKAHPREPWDRLMLLSLVGLCLFLSQATSMSWLRLCSVSLPALIVLAWFARSPARVVEFFRRLLWGIGAAVMIAQPVLAQTDSYAHLDTPTGREAFLDPDVYEKFRWVGEHTRPGDYSYQASDCNLYYLLDLRNPTRLAFITAGGYTRPDQVQDVVASLETSHVRYVLWSVWLDFPYPGRAQQFDAAALSPIRDYLHTHYHLIRNFGDPDYEQVWERNP